jgi:hypothetical protein
MGTTRLDMDTADRILQGLVDPADAPPGYAPVVQLLATVRAPHAAVPTTIITAGPAPADRPRRRFMLASPPFRSRLTVAATTIALAAASTTAYAAGLPAAASTTAHGVLQSLGVTPGSSAHAKTQPSGTHGAEVSARAHTTTATGSAKGAIVAAVASNGRSHAGRHHDTTTRKTDGASGKGSAHGHGAEISGLAHSTTGTAGVKGATVSKAASGGKSHAGEHGHHGEGGSTHGKAATAGSHRKDGEGGGHGSGKGPARS